MRYIPKMKEIPLGLNRAVDNQAAQRNTSRIQAAVLLISTITVSDNLYKSSCSFLGKAHLKMKLRKREISSKG